MYVVSQIRTWYRKLSRAVHDFPWGETCVRVRCCQLFRCSFKQSDADLSCLFLQDAGLLALVAAANTADVSSTLRAQPEVGVRGGRRDPRKRLSGVTREHMLYWVLQADIDV